MLFCQYKKLGKTMTTAERINKILEIKNLNKSDLAIKLGIPKPTMYFHFKNKNQDFLIQYLDQILEIFPDISKQWLYFEEGDMYKDSIKISQLRTEEAEVYIKAIENFEKQLQLMQAELEILKKQANLLEIKLKKV